MTDITIANQIRSRATELNEKIREAYSAGLRVDINLHDIGGTRFEDSRPVVEVRVWRPV